MEDLPCFLYRKLDLKSSAPKTENRHIYEPPDVTEKYQTRLIFVHRLSTFSAIFSAGVLQRCSAVALLLFTTLLEVVLPSRWELIASASL